MSKTYLPYEPDQQLLLPAALQEWLPDHLASTSYRRGGPVGHVGDHRSLRAGTAWRAAVSSTDDGQGVALRQLRRCGESRRIAQRLHEDIAFRVLAANNTPDFRTISDFRKDSGCAVGPVHTGTGVVPAGGAGEAGAVALDGTKVKANASIRR